MISSRALEDMVVLVNLRLSNFGRRNSRFFSSTWSIFLKEPFLNIFYLKLKNNKQLEIINLPRFLMNMATSAESLSNSKLTALLYK